MLSARFSSIPLFLLQEVGQRQYDGEQEQHQHGFEGGVTVAHRLHRRTVEPDRRAIRITAAPIPVTPHIYVPGNEGTARKMA